MSTDSLPLDLISDDCSWAWGSQVQGSLVLGTCFRVRAERSDLRGPGALGLGFGEEALGLQDAYVFPKGFLFRKNYTVDISHKMRSSDIHRNASSF